MTIGIDLGDVWSHYCTLNEDGEVVDRQFRTSPSGVEKWFTDLARVRIAMEAGTHLIWVIEQLQELGHEVIVANLRELRAISHSDRKSDTVDAEKLARDARLDPKILRPISHRTVAQPEALTLIRCPSPDGSPADGGRERGASTGEALRLSTLPASSSTLCFARRCLAVLPPGLAQALGPVLEQIATMTVKIKHYDRRIQRLTETEYTETQALIQVYRAIVACRIGPSQGRPKPGSTDFPSDPNQHRASNRSLKVRIETRLRTTTRNDHRQQPRQRRYEEKTLTR